MRDDAGFKYYSTDSTHLEMGIQLRFSYSNALLIFIFLRQIASDSFDGKFIIIYILKYQTG